LFLCGLHYQRYNMISSHITQHAHYRLSILRPAHNKRLLLYNNVCLSIFTIVSILYILINDLILVSINKLLYFITVISISLFTTKNIVTTQMKKRKLRLFSYILMVLFLTANLQKIQINNLNKISFNIYILYTFSLYN
jgi:hypothetical protein